MKKRRKTLSQRIKEKNKEIAKLNCQRRQVDKELKKYQSPSITLALISGKKIRKLEKLENKRDKLLKKSIKLNLQVSDLLYRDIIRKR